MRRVMLLALLGLGLPTAALATGIDYKTGKFESGTISGAFTSSIRATEVGSLDTITIDTGTLTKLPKSHCAKGFTCYEFSGGSVTVTHGGSTVFTDSLEGGLVKEGDDSADVTATLLPNGRVAQGTAVATLEWHDPHARGQGERNRHWRRSQGEHNRHWRRGGGGEEHTLNTGSTDVSLSTNTIPEPSTLGLLGTGLIGLAGLARRKLKLPT